MSRILGTSLLEDGPGDSARRRCMLRFPPSGTIIMPNTSIPMPPTQCVKLRHKSMDLSRASTSVSMLEPVVVQPETISKTASR